MIRSANCRRWSLYGFGPLAAVATLALVLSACNRGETPAPVTDAGGQEGGQKDASAETAQGVLQRMVAAYQQARSYSDRGEIQLKSVQQGQSHSDKAAYSVQFERPGKLNLHAYQVRQVADGQLLHATIEDEASNNFDNQVLEQKVDKSLKLTDLGRDERVGNLMTGVGGPPVTLELLLDAKPLEPLISGAVSASFAEPGKIDGREYHRVAFADDRGTTVFWIDPETYVLRRIELPTEFMLADIPEDQRPESFTITAEFVDARLDAPLAGETFAMKLPDDAKRVYGFVDPLSARYSPLLGEHAKEFTLTTLEGKPITGSSLAGKIVVLDFWFSTCEPCRRNAPNLQKVYEKFKDNDKLAFYAVHVPASDQEAAMSPEQLRATLDSWGLAVPIVRDDATSTARAFDVTGFPCLVVLDARGVVQQYEVGVDPQLATQLTEDLDKLLAGGTVYTNVIQKARDEYAKDLQAADPSKAPPEGDTVSVAKVPAAAASEPKELSLTEAFNCTQLTNPGNLLVVPQPSGDDRVYLVNEFKEVAELDAAGKVVARHELDVPADSYLTYLRTAADQQGQRVYLTGGAGQQRFHAFDGQWKPKFTYPPPDYKSEAIADVRLADLAGNGQLAAYVGYWQNIGVQRVSLDGKRMQWGGKIADQVLSVDLTPRGKDGQQQLVVLGFPGKILALDAAGEVVAQTEAAHQGIQRLVIGYTPGEAAPTWCGLIVAPREAIVVGMAGDGTQSWQYPLATGTPQNACEPLVYGRALPGEASQWVAAEADGFVNVLDGDGKLIDRFGHGAEIHGINLARLDGKPTLLVASVGTVKAYRLEPKAPTTP